MVERLISLLYDHKQVILNYSLQILGNIASGSAEVAQNLFSYNLLDNIGHLLLYEYPLVRKNLYFLLSNLGCGT